MDERKSSDHHEQFLRESEQKPNNLSGFGSGSSERSVSPTKKALQIKLIEEGQNHNRSSGKENRICKVCKKGFGSGKALGGHMRIHAHPQAQTQVQEKQAQLQLQDNFPISDTNTKKSCNGGGYASPGGPMNSKTKTMIDERSSNPSCYLCGKKFQSMKSLFGHMRCHPERAWRGIQPPPPPPPSSSPSPPPLPVAAAATGLKKSTSISSATIQSDKDSCGVYHHPGNWSATGKRGSKAIHAVVPPPSASASASTSASEEQYPMPDMEAAYQLMMLANSKSHSNSYRNRIEDPIQTLGNLSKKRKSEDDEESISQSDGVQNSKYLPKPLPMKLSITSPSSGRLEEEEEGDSCSKTSTDCSSLIRGQPDQSDQLSCMFEMVLGQKLKKLKMKKKKKMKLRDLERVVEMGPIDYKQQPLTTTATLSDRFKCRTCNKTFTSHQALGGHRSSHKITDDEEEEEESDSQTQSSSYPCKICNKTFQTGQALGGHQRCHWMSTAETAPSSSVASAPPEDIISKTGRVMLDFDLNEMPVSSSMEDDNDEVIKSVSFITSNRPAGLAAERASSSNNSATETDQKPRFCSFHG
ncbi:uncharacterized protein LOC122650869 [Telopea speciosissima]|uniref:uncharacterized protein LOC122650869 n=1 Tax=Telopea speciosissima TaxID=54955 RepID=UPI001CC3D84B|nr:uncharacterized protein LOC122650869 [Telopea speciosissima]